MSYSDQHYGAGDPACPICGGVGYLCYDVPESHPHFGRVFSCQCRKADQLAEQQAYLRRLGGLENLASKTFATFNPQGAGLSLIERDRVNLQLAYELARSYADQPHGWLILIGGYGCGKTHLAAAIANAQVEAGRPVLFVTAPDLLDHLRASYQEDVDQESGYAARFDEVRTIPLLVLDDVGTESPTPWAMEKLYQILNHRYNAQLPTVISTNQSLEEFDPRIRSRLSDPDISQIVSITAPDYRRAISSAQSDLNTLGLYKTKTFSSFDADRGLPRKEADNLRLAYQVARSFADSPDGWLILTGTYGCGKTHLAAAIANEQVIRNTGVMFVTVPDLLDHLRAAYAPNSPASPDRRFSEVKTAPLLVLDDLGTESATPWASVKLYQLLNYRYEARLPTVVTTAYRVDELESRIDPRLAIRMRDKRISKVLAILAPAYLGERTRPPREAASGAR